MVAPRLEHVNAKECKSMQKRAGRCKSVLAAPVPLFRNVHNFSEINFLRYVCKRMHTDNNECNNSPTSRKGCGLRSRETGLARRLENPGRNSRHPSFAPPASPQDHSRPHASAGKDRSNEVRRRMV